MVCKFCGNEIDDNSDFCFICGQKVEAKEPAYAAAPVANVYTQPEAAPADEPTAEAEPVEAPAAEPVAAAPVSASVAAQRSKKELKAEMKAAKKAEKAAKYAIASRAARFFSFIFVLVGLIIYSKAKKEGNEEKAVAILNTFMTGLCFKMCIVIGVMIKKFML